MRRIILLLFLIHATANAQINSLYYTNTGKISFKSESKQELIAASSDEMQGIIDEEKKTFVFKVKIRTFNGFNSALQQEHFNEKFLESEKFPQATFMGKIIEVTIKNGIINIQSHFTVALSDHNIKVPKVVHEKVSSEISVEISAQLKKKTAN